MSSDIAATDPIESAALGLTVDRVHEDKAIPVALDAAEYAMSIVVTDAQSLREAERAIVDIARGLKAVEACRKPVTKRLDAAKSAVMAYVKTMTEPMAKADAYLGTQVTRYLSKTAAMIENEKVERVAKLEAAARAGLPPPIVRSDPVVPDKLATDDGSGVSTTFNLSIEMERPYEVPEGLLCLAPGALAWMKDQIASGQFELAKKDGATAVHRGIRATWSLGIKRTT